MEIEFPAIYKAIGYALEGCIGAGDPRAYRPQDEVYTLGLSKYKRDRFVTAETDLAKLSDENLKFVACCDSSDLITEETDYLITDLADLI